MSSIYICEKNCILETLMYDQYLYWSGHNQSLKLTNCFNSFYLFNIIIFYSNACGPGWLKELVGLPNNSYKPITNTTWVRPRLCNLQKRWFRLASDKVYQLLAHGQWFSPGTTASTTTKAGHRDIAEILLKVALST